MLKLTPILKNETQDHSENRFLMPHCVAFGRLHLELYLSKWDNVCFTDHLIFDHQQMPLLLIVSFFFPATHLLLWIILFSFLAIYIYSYQKTVLASFRMDINFSLILTFKITQFSLKLMLP